LPLASPLELFRREQGVDQINENPDSHDAG
jgi:hypothetical protein